MGGRPVHRRLQEPVVAVSADALPRVEGRHRNRALAAARRARAIELRTQGCTYDQIAEELGYANRGTVYRIISDALAEREHQAVDSLRFLESARLDSLQSALWDKAMSGDVKAARSILGIIVARAHLLGLQGAFTGNQASKPRTVVVRPTV
jgi:hypothetical protein